MASSTRPRRRAAKNAAPKRAKPAKKARRATASRQSAATPTSRRKTAKAAPRKAPAKTARPTIRRGAKTGGAPPGTGSHALIVAPPSASGPQWLNRLRDGTHVLIRPITKADATLERRFIERLSDESKRLRFLGVIKTPSAEFLKRLTDIDYGREMAFVALIHDAGEKKEIGVSRYGIAADGKTCECAVAVADEWQGKGLGVLLMRHLIDVARQQGIRRMISIDSADNTRMRELASYLGFRRQADPDDLHQVIHSLDL